MQLFKVEIQETRTKLVEVEAADEKEAVEIATNAYQNHDVELDDEDFLDVDFVIVQED
jgi:hypothetical protein